MDLQRTLLPATASRLRIPTLVGASAAAWALLTPTYASADEPAPSSTVTPVATDSAAPATSSAPATPLAPPPEERRELPPPPPEKAAEVEKAEKVEDVRVGGQRLANAGGSAHVIGEKTLKRFKHDDPHAILPLVPGVYVRGEDGYGLRPNIGIRGASSDRSKKVTLMEDGILFGPAPYSAPAAYYFPLMARMRSVRVVKGPGSVAYGPQTVGGAVDLLTHDVPVGHQGFADAAIGQYGYNKLHGRFGLGNDAAGLLVEGIHLGSTGFKHIDNLDQDTGFSRNEVMTKGRWVLDPDARERHELGVKFTFSNEISNETYLGLSDEDFRKDPYRRYFASRFDRMEWHRTSIAVSHRYTPTSKFELRTTVYRHDLDRTWRKVNEFKNTSIESVLSDPSTSRNRVYYGVLTGAQNSLSDAETIMIGPNHRVFVSQGLDTVATLDARTGPISHRIEYGIRLHNDEIDRRHTQDGYRVVSGDLVSDGNRTQDTAINRAWTYALALRASDAIQWKNLYLTPGVRVEFIQSQLEDALQRTKTGAAYHVLLPGVGAYYAFTREFGLLAGVHRGFTPSPAGDTSGRPESSTNFEGGARYTSRRFRAEVIAFYNDYSNFTDICSESNGCQARNIDRKIDGGSADIYGAEVFGEADVPLWKGAVMPARVSYTLTQAFFRSTFTSNDPLYGTVKAGDELPYIPIHQWTANVGIETKQAGLNLAGTFVGDMRESPGQALPTDKQLTDAYFLLDAAVNYKMKPFTFYVIGKNILGNEYLTARRPFGARPGAPRTIMFGTQVAF
ncbi:MAG: TonB-dependent receptor [Polyangiaceae bacterium]